MAYKSSNHRPVKGSEKDHKEWEKENEIQERKIEKMFLKKHCPMTRVDVEINMNNSHQKMLNTSVVRALANLTYGVETPGDLPNAWRIKPCLVMCDTVMGIYGRPVNRWIHKKYYKEWKKTQKK